MFKTNRRFVVAVVGFSYILALAGCSGSPESTVAGGCQAASTFPTLKEGVLTIAAVNAMPKLDAKPGSGAAEGTSGIMITQFAEANCLTMDWLVLSGPAAVETMAQGRADIAGGDWTKSEKRGEVMSQSDPVWYDPTAITSSTGIDSLEGLKSSIIGANLASTYFAPLQKMYGADSVRGYDLPESVFQDLATGRLDAAVGGAAESVWMAKQAGADDVKVVAIAPDPEFPELTKIAEMNWPHIKDNPELTKAINAFIKEARSDGSMEAALTKYGLTDPIQMTGK